MAESSTSDRSRPKILEELVEAGKGAFDPSIADQVIREAGLLRYNELVQSTETWVLLPALNTLIKPNVLPEWLRRPLMETLTLLPLRKDGVRGTMEFVFSVHPSNASRVTDAKAPQKQGASITHEAVAVATRLLASVPSSMTPKAWFAGIASQLFDLMDGSDGPDLARTAAQIVGFGILGQRQFGAPDAPGWVVFVKPLLDNINPSPESPLINEGIDDEIIHLQLRPVLVESQLLQRSLERLRILVLSNPSPGLCKRIVKPVLLQVWVLASWHGPGANVRQFQMTARDLLETYLRLFGTSDAISIIIPNLLSKGASAESIPAWAFQDAQNDTVKIVAEPNTAATSIDIDWGQLQEKAAALVGILNSTCSAENISSMFLDLFQKWVKTSQESASVNLVTGQSTGTTESPVQELAEVAILQQLLEKAPDKLVSHFDQLLDLICQVLKADEGSRLADDVVAIFLSLLNLVVTAPTFRKSDINSDVLKVIEEGLERLRRVNPPQISQTATNLALLLRYRSELDQDEEPMLAPSSGQIEDRRVYNLALNYITGAENPPPVVSEGLDLLAGLVTKQSPALDVTAVTVLLSNLLSNNEDYINLRVVKMFTQLAEKHPKSTIRELLDHYLDSQEKASTDTRLRFGEALLQVIERLGGTFTGEIASHSCETLLSIAGRRGHRPKTMEKQVRDEKLKTLKKRKEGDDDDDDNMNEDERNEEERKGDDIIAQIVQGWDSKRGTEDVRMRTSALSILGTALETNISGIGSSLVSTSVDLCINILTLETEMEKGILRRAAILVVLGFVRALEQARESGRSLGFGLTDGSREDILRTLQYVAGTDNDGLVQQHARDVIESLEAWQMTSLLAAQREPEKPGLSTLAGLSINPAMNISGTSTRGPHPRIEEIE